MPVSRLAQFILSVARLDCKTNCDCILAASSRTAHSFKPSISSKLNASPTLNNAVCFVPVASQTVHKSCHLKS